MFLMLKFISYRDDDLSSIIPNKGTSREKERNGGNRRRGEEEKENDACSTHGFHPALKSHYMTSI